MAAHLRSPTPPISHPACHSSKPRSTSPSRAAGKPHRGPDPGPDRGGKRNTRRPGRRPRLRHRTDSERSCAPTRTPAPTGCSRASATASSSRSRRPIPRATAGCRPCPGRPAVPETRELQADPARRRSERGRGVASRSTARGAPGRGAAGWTEADLEPIFAEANRSLASGEPSIRIISPGGDSSPAISASTPRSRDRSTRFASPWTTRISSPPSGRPQRRRAAGRTAPEPDAARHRLRRGEQPDRQ